MKRIGMVAALPGELKPLVRGWQEREQVFAGRIGDLEAVAACAGIGAAAATSACERILASGAIDTLVSIGWAGSLSCGLQVGSAYAVREVIDARTGESFPTGSPKGQRLITLDHVAGREEKRRLAEAHQAVMVDMEAATVARVARDRGLGFFCCKAISDGPNEKLPDFDRFTSADGHFRMPAFLAWTAVHPQYWGSLRRLGRNTHIAAEELARFVPRCLGGSQ